MNGPITLRWWYSRCRSCKWLSKELPNRKGALEAYLKHAKKHCTIGEVERRLEAAANSVPKDSEGEGENHG